MATPRLGLVVEDKPTELSCTVCIKAKRVSCSTMYMYLYMYLYTQCREVPEQALAGIVSRVFGIICAF